MSQMIRLAAIAALSAAAVLAETWSGPLVDSKCYGAEQRNVNPTDTQTYVDRDIGYGIRYCAPNHKTKYFAVVGQYGTRLKFDAAGNAKAAELVKNVKKKHELQVIVTGQLVKHTIQVTSVSPPSEK